MLESIHVRVVMNPLIAWLQRPEMPAVVAVRRVQEAVAQLR
jgi:hypothetical protein